MRIFNSAAVGAEQLIHSDDLQRRCAMAVGHDRRPWR
jgi:hypothetical protein